MAAGRSDTQVLITELEDGSNDVAKVNAAFTEGVTYITAQVRKVEGQTLYIGDAEVNDNDCEMTQDGLEFKACSGGEDYTQAAEDSDPDGALQTCQLDLENAGEFDTDLEMDDDGKKIDFIQSNTQHILEQSGNCMFNNSQNGFTAPSSTISAV